MFQNLAAITASTQRALVILAVGIHFASVIEAELVRLFGLQG